MSDLDADLYGGEFEVFVVGNTSSHGLDLYGNDEGAEEQPQPQEENDIQQPLPEAPTELSPTTSTLAEQPSSNVSNIETMQPNGMTPQVSSTNGALSSQYIQQTLQKIPTYEEPQPSEYREPQQVRSDGVYQNIPVNERSVRPSEMKDEG